MWEDLDAVVKVVPWAKAWVRVNADKRARLHISLSEPMLKDCGNPKRCNVQLGREEDKVLVRLVFTADGKFAVKPVELGGARIQGIQVKAPVPDGARDAEPCEMVSKSKTEAILALPLAAWEAQLKTETFAVAKGVEKATASNNGSGKTPPPAAPALARPNPGNPLNAAEYLKSKGIACRRLAGDWWDVNRERVPRMEILTLVNAQRRKANLPALTMDEID